VLFHHLGCNLCLVYGRLGFLVSGVCCLSSPGYVSVFYVFSLLVCVYLTIASCSDVTFRGFLLHCYMFMMSFLGLCMSLARVGLAGITFAQEIMVAIDTLGSTACRQNYTAFLDDMYLLRPSVNFC
jgi:hypothetical protein